MTATSPAAVRACLADILADLPEGDATDLWDHGVMDSYAVIDVVMTLESAFGVTFAPESLRMENFASLEAMARTVDALKVAA